MQNIEELLPEDSWFRSYLRVWPAAEPPQSYILFAAMAMMGAILGRRVWFDHDPHKLYPMLNILLIGPSGIGKSTSIMMGRRLLDHLPENNRPQFIAGASTTEKLHEDLVPHPLAVVFASELANFFGRQKYNEGLIPYVTELLDYAPVERRTRSLGLIQIAEPSVTVIGGSTVEWLQEQLPDTATSGGFLGRFLIVSEEHKGRRVADPKRYLTTKQRLDMLHNRALCLDNFMRVVLQIPEGPIDFKDYEAADAYGVWYDTHKAPTGHLAPFAARAGEFVLRLSILLAVSREDTGITKADVQGALRLYAYATRKLQEVVVPYTQQGKLLSMVMQAVKDKPLGEAEICRAMRNHATAQDVRKYVDSLLQSEDLRRTEDGKFYRTRR